MTTMGEVTIRMHAPGLAERLWCHKTGMPLPMATGYSGPWLSAWARLPCPLCGRHFGGHECGGSVPDPMKGPGHGIGICSSCTIRRHRDAADTDGA